MRKLVETGKCNSCGDLADLYEYNKSKTCANCLGMDRRGVARKSILDKNTRKYNEGKLRGTGKRSW